MLFLQAGFVRDRLWLWGEVPAVGEETVAGAAAGPALSPFSPSFARLRQVLDELDIDTTLDGTIAYLDMPTADGWPIPSSPLIQRSPVKSPPAIRRWAVEALPLQANEALELLARCVGHQTLLRGVAVGVSLAFWTNAMRFAGALVAREQVLPRIRTDGERLQAHWQAVLGGQEPARFDALVRAMPPACRGMVALPDGPLTAGTTLLRGFLDRAVDAIIRQTPKAKRTTPATPHDAWLQALSGPDGTVTGKLPELTVLSEQVASWQRPLLTLLDAPFRLCFRLEEPKAQTDPWRVQYLLQARDDPSLILSASQGWKPGASEAAQFRQRRFAPREYLLTALGQAATLCPEVDSSLTESAPESFAIDGTGAYGFLTNSAGQLEQAGFGVLLPAWWTGSRPKLTLRAAVKPPKMQSAGTFTLDALLNVDWQAALGDEKLTLKELNALAALKSPLVQLRGQWVEIRPDEIQKLLDGWQKKREKATLGEVVRLALGAGERGGFEVSGVDATGWLKELLNQMRDQAGYSEVEPSPNLQAQLRPYQKRGLSWLLFLRRWRLGACLADDMGLGKTLQMLATILHDQEAGETRPVLLVCPTSVLGNWQREAARFTPSLATMLHHGTTRPRKAAFVKLARAQAIVLTSYSLLHRDCELLAGVEWAGVVLDEAQNIKNPETKQAKAARAIPGGYRVLLTGTPVENHVGDLWSLFEFLNRGLLGNQASFRKRFFLPIQTGRDPQAADRLKRLTGPFVLRRLKTDKSVIADLPDKVEMKVFCRLTKEQATLYRAEVLRAEKALADSEGIQRRGLILSLLTRMKQICNHPAHFLGDHSTLPNRSGKLNRLTELYEEILSAGERGLIFTQYTEMGELLKSYLQDTFGREVLFLHGGVPRKQRDALVARFQGEDGPPLFVLSLKAGGTGLNLTAANHVVHFDRWWNPAVENQATDRAFRIGQTRKVLVHKFTCTGTLEERIDRMIDSKAEIASKVVGTGEQWLTEMSNSDLRDLLKLDPDAVEE